VAILDVDDVPRQPRVKANAERAMLNVLVSILFCLKPVSHNSCDICHFNSCPPSAFVVHNKDKFFVVPWIFESLTMLLFVELRIEPIRDIKWDKASSTKVRGRKINFCS
jgi:hypothetical protein